jgi:hypothetical protein
LGSIAPIRSFLRLNAAGSNPRDVEKGSLFDPRPRECTARARLVCHVCHVTQTGVTAARRAHNAARDPAPDPDSIGVCHPNNSIGSLPPGTSRRGVLLQMAGERGRPPLPGPRGANGRRLQGDPRGDQIWRDGAGRRDAASSTSVRWPSDRIPRLKLGWRSAASMLRSSAGTGRYSVVKQDPSWLCRGEGAPPECSGGKRRWNRGLCALRSGGVIPAVNGDRDLFA